MGFKFERNLPHQKRAVESILKVFENLPVIEPEEVWIKLKSNPLIDSTSIQYKENIKHVVKMNSISVKPTYSNIIDIMMETGTGKTYTYTKAMFELNKHFGISKFIIVVPTLSIKAGTVNFLKSDSARQHFKDEYGKSINLYVVESKKGTKNRRSYMPSPIYDFVNAERNKNTIEVLIINSGMLNSETMYKSYDRMLLDRYTTPFDALSAVNPFVIVDEPHRFPRRGKTWKNIQRLNPQYILRFGATFEDHKFENLIYTLTAVEAFNRNLVKGVIGYVEEFEEGKNVLVRLINTDGKEATFELIEDGKKKKRFKLTKRESLEKIHPHMQELFIEKLNKTEVFLSNGLSLRRGDKLNPYSFSITLEEKMIEKAIKKHFEIEKRLIEERRKKGLPRIKPLTLFFIDNIDEYRKENGKLRKIVEQYIEIYARKALEEAEDEFYRNYLKKTLENISKTHGGYFSRDNIEKDEEIEEEINKILHEKEKLLSFEEPMRFIFSKWTLREGWDNPNVFQICKLRSSGSEISKLQEVGRGLRLPVNEYMNREKGEFYLHYYVDFTEADFVEKLIKEINDKSNFGAEGRLDRLTEDLVNAICREYELEERQLRKQLHEEGIVDAFNNYKFIGDGFEKLKEKYPKAFIKTKLIDGKIRKSTEKVKRKVKTRIEKYSELKELWEKLNQKFIIEYKIGSENEFKEIFKAFIKDNIDKLKGDSFLLKEKKVVTRGNKAYIEEKAITEEIADIKTMKYGEFIKRLALELKINLNTLHNAFKELLTEGVLDINQYLNSSTIRLIKQGFNNYLLQTAFTKFQVEYKKVKSSIHPTKLTDKDGRALEEISASDIGIKYSKKEVADSFYFEELFYDSELEKQNITTNLEEVIVFLKIPKNSIKIPIPGGKSYSPDFAYVLRFKDSSEKLCFVVETKDKEEKDLSLEEKLKIKFAEKLFKDKIKIQFKKQMRNKKIEDLIKEVLQKSN